MEGLIPFLMQVIRKQRPQNSYRCLSDASNRSYHLLTGSDAVDGSSSHHRTQTELFSDQISTQKQQVTVGNGSNRGGVSYSTNGSRNFSDYRQQR